MYQVQSSNLFQAFNVKLGMADNLQKHRIKCFKAAKANHEMLRKSRIKALGYDEMAKNLNNALLTVKI